MHFLGMMMMMMMIKLVEVMIMIMMMVMVMVMVITMLHENHTYTRTCCCVHFPQSPHLIISPLTFSGVAAIVEVNSETDFVSRNSHFVELIDNVLQAVELRDTDEGEVDVEALKQTSLANPTDTGV